MQSTNSQLLFLSFHLSFMVLVLLQLLVLLTQSKSNLTVKDNLIIVSFKEQINFFFKYTKLKDFPVV